MFFSVLKTKDLPLYFRIYLAIGLYYVTGILITNSFFSTFMSTVDVFLSTFNTLVFFFRIFIFYLVPFKVLVDINPHFLLLRFFCDRFRSIMVTFIVHITSSRRIRKSVLSRVYSVMVNTPYFVIYFDDFRLRQSGPRLL